MGPVDVRHRVPEVGGRFLYKSDTVSSDWTIYGLLLRVFGPNWVIFILWVFKIWDKFGQLRNHVPVFGAFRKNGRLFLVTLVIHHRSSQIGVA